MLCLLRAYSCAEAVEPLRAVVAPNRATVGPSGVRIRQLGTQTLGPLLGCPETLSTAIVVGPAGRNPLVSADIADILLTSAEEKGAERGTVQFAKEMLHPLVVPVQLAVVLREVVRFY